MAQQLLDSYTAYIGIEDLHNSKGARLTQPWQVLRQDRANFHKFGIRDPEDESDGFFSNKGNRALLEKMLRKGKTPGWVYDAIVNDTPLIQVTVYNDFVEVAILDENSGAGGAPAGGNPPVADGGGMPASGGAIGDVEPNTFPANKANGALEK